MSETLAKTLKLTPSPATEEIKLISANQSPIESKGIVDVEISLQGYIVPFTFHVLRSLSHPMILGIDFLKMSGAIINCAQRSISLFDGLVNAALTTCRDRDSVLRLTQNVVIPARTEALIRLNVPPRFRHKTSLIETYGPIKNMFLAVAGAVIHPTTNVTICRICNIGLTPRKLRANMPIARISKVDLSDPGNRAMLSLDAEMSQNACQTLPEINLPPHEERMQFLKEKGLEIDNQNLTPEQLSQLSALLYEFEDVFCSEYDNLPVSSLPPYHIKLKDDRPIRQKRYPLPPLQEELLERYADKLLAAKIVEPSQSGWNAAALLIKKANFDPLKRDQLSSWRLCLDYRKQNAVILNDEFQPLTDSQSVFLNIAQTSNRKFYSSIDWTCAFFQCPLDEESRAVTAFSTRTRHLQFTRTSQGLKCSPWAFLSSIYSLFQTELRSNMSVYCDDSLIYHSDYSEHLKFLRGIFEKLRSARLRINPTKSVFAKEKSLFSVSNLHQTEFNLIPEDFKKSETSNQLQMSNK
jgi:hypothetical protein